MSQASLNKHCTFIPLRVITSPIACGFGQFVLRFPVVRVQPEHEASSSQLSLGLLQLFGQIEHLPRRVVRILNTSQTVGSFTISLQYYRSDDTPFHHYFEIHQFVPKHFKDAYSCIVCLVVVKCFWGWGGTWTNKKPQSLRRSHHWQNFLQRTKRLLTTSQFIFVQQLKCQLFTSLSKARHETSEPTTSTQFCLRRFSVQKKKNI